MPLPPPPAAGLTSSGRPISSAARRRALSLCAGAVVAGHDRDVRARAPAFGLRPCRPSPGSPRAAARPSGSRQRSRPPRSPRSRRGSRSPGGSRRRRRPRAASTTSAIESRSTASGPSVGGTTARIPRRSAVRVIRAAISPRFATNRVRIGATAGAGEDRIVDRLTRQSRQSRHAIALRRRRAGSRPVAIHRWTVRVVAPIRRAAWLGLSSSVMRDAIVARRLVRHACHRRVAPQGAITAPLTAARPLARRPSVW